MQLYACVLMSDDFKSCLFVCNYNAVNRPVNVVRSLVVCSSNKILTMVMGPDQTGPDRSVVDLVLLYQ